MKKICIAAPEQLTMPAIKGGAIETLLQYVIDENEKTPRANLTILATFDADADAVVKKQGYQYTEFVYLKKTNFQCIANFIYRIVRKISNKIFRISLYHREVFTPILSIIMFKDMTLIDLSTKRVRTMSCYQSQKKLVKRIVLHIYIIILKALSLLR
ncbi:hypothetical protein BTJ14_08075 [Lactobacillus delbrueckii subsp. bulgaricus]|nr:hypothetical protein [Lactobacillus delbrueckii subsp. bulgaricus]